MAQTPASDPGNAPPEEWADDLADDEANELRELLDGQYTGPTEADIRAGGD
jgi:hypothetical protein